MVVIILLAGLAVLALGMIGLLVRTAVQRGVVPPSLFEAMGLGAVTDFFDTLGIGSFAPTTAWLKFRKLVPDSFIPATLNVGHALPTIAQALIFISLVRVDPWLLVACIVAAVAGSAVGAPMVQRAPIRVIQAVVGVALLVAAALYAAKNLGWIPDQDEGLLSLAPLPFAIAVVGHFIMGILMMFGIGLYAPSLIVLSMLGLNPVAAFPIMMGACAFLMPLSSVRFLRSTRIDLRIVLGIAIGGIPAVLVAALIVQNLDLYLLRWLVVVVVLYAAALLLRSALTDDDKTVDTAPSQP